MTTLAKFLRRLADKLDPSAPNRHHPAPAPVTVNINGALDPAAVGKQVEQILARRSRPLGRS